MSILYMALLSIVEFSFWTTTTKENSPNFIFVIAKENGSIGIKKTVHTN